ncbi:MAG TPA: hypothetical protein VIQ02_16620 [Jiangellaceae bacterium]
MGEEPLFDPDDAAWRAAATRRVVSDEPWPADEPLFISRGLSVPVRHSDDMTNRTNLIATADGLDFLATQAERQAATLRSHASLLRSIARHPAPQHDEMADE